jgi:hypothetical protein
MMDSRADVGLPRAVPPCWLKWRHHVRSDEAFVRPLRHRGEKEKHLLHVFRPSTNPEFVVLARELQIHVLRTCALQQHRRVA